MLKVFFKIFVLNMFFLTSVGLSASVSYGPLTVMGDKSLKEFNENFSSSKEGISDFVKVVSENYQTLDENLLGFNDLKSIFLSSLDGLKFFFENMEVTLSKDRFLIHVGDKLLGSYPYPNSIEGENVYDKMAKIFAVIVKNGKDYSKNLRNADDRTILYIVFNHVVKKADLKAEMNFNYDAFKSRDVRYTYGFTFLRVKGGLQVLDVFKNSSADVYGIKKNDIIVQVNGKSIDKVTDEEIAGTFYSTETDDVNLGVFSFLRREYFEVDISNNKIFTHKADSELTTDGLLKISIKDFGADMAKSVRSQLTYNLNSAKGIVLDLRGNAKGKIAEVLELLDYFSFEGNLLSVESKLNAVKTFVNDGVASYNFSLKDIPVVILVDNMTKGPAEYFVFAMQLKGLAVAVGYPTYGKATVDNHYDLSNGISYTFPTSKVSWGGYSFDKIGVFPLVCMSSITTDNKVIDFEDAVRAEKFNGNFASFLVDKNSAGNPEMKDGCKETLVEGQDFSMKVARRIALDKELWNNLLGQLIFK